MAHQDRNRLYVGKFTHKHMGSYEIYYDKNLGQFTTRIRDETISADTAKQVETTARAFLDAITAYKWKSFIQISKETGHHGVNVWGSGYIPERKTSMTIKFERVDLADALDPKARVDRVFRVHVDDLDQWTDKAQWEKGLTAKSFCPADDDVLLPYTVELWDSLLRMEAMLNDQREKLDKLLSHKDLAKLLVQQASKLPSLPASTKRRKK